MATLQGKAVKNTYRQVLQIGANNVGVSGTAQRVQDGAGVNTALSLSTIAATIHGDLTITGDLIITGGGIQIQDLIDDTVASLIQNGTGITWAYNDTNRTLTPTITIATADGGVQGDFLQLNTGANEASAVGKLKWNTADGTMDIGLMGGNVILQVGQEQVARVLNNSGTNFTEAGYQAVKITSAQGQRLAVGLAQANNEANSKDTLGLVTENISNNQEGFVTTSGLVRQIDTTGDLQTEVWIDGDTLYLSPTVPGRITKVKPLAPNQTVIMGFVVYAHKNQGKIFVKVDNGYEISELHDVRITSVANNNILKYNSSLAVWENVAGTTTNISEGTNLYYTQARFDSAFAAKTTTNLTEGANLYFTTARGDANFATNFATKTTTNLPEGSNLYYTNTRARLALAVTAGTGIDYNNTTGVFALSAIPNASLTNSSITINSQAVALGASVTLTTTNIAEGTNLYWTDARFDTRFSTKTTTNLTEGTNLYYTQARFNTAFTAKSTTDLAEGTNLYYTDARSRLAISESAVGLDYSNTSGVFSLTAGYAIPTTVKLGQYDTAYNRSIVSAAVSGTTTKTLSLTQQDANVVSATWTDLGITTINGTANQITATTVANTTTLAFTNDVTMPNNLVVSGNLTINGTATYVNTQSISAKDPLFEVANDNNTTDAVDIGYYGRYYDTPQTRVEFTGLFRDASDAGKFKFFTGLVDEPTNVVNTTGTGYTVGTLVANFEGNLAGTANAANALSTARTIAASGDAVWSVSFDGSANVTSALTLANTGVTATTYGTSTAVPTIAVDSKGRITSASNTNIAFPVTTVNGFAGTVVLTTTNIAEGSNQYFTTGKVSAYLTGAISTVLTADLTASRALVSDGTGKIIASASATSTEVSYLAGVTSAIQTQFSGKLSLTGGTLTGALSGTSATFSSTNTATAFIPSGATIPTNGMYLSAANTLDFSTNTTNRVTISSTGNVGINCTPTTSLTIRPINVSTNALSILDPAGTAQRIAQLSFGINTNDGELSLDSNGTNNVRISSNRDSYFNGGNVGIGCTPSYKLHVRPTTNVNMIVTNNGANLQIGTSNDAGNAAIPLNFTASSFSFNNAATFSSSIAATSASFSSTIENTGGNGFQSSVEGGFRLRNTANTGNLGGLVRRSFWAGGGLLDTQIFAENGYGIYLNVDGSTTKGIIINPSGFVVIGGTASSRRLQVNTSGNDGIRIISSNDNPTLDLMQGAAANVNARNWRIVTNWEGWGTMDFQSGTNNTSDPATTRLSLSGVGGTSILSSALSATAFNSTIGNDNIVFDTSGATTGYLFMRIRNTSGNLIVGTEGSATGNLASGDLAYSSGIYTGNTRALHFGVDQTVAMTIINGGNIGMGTNTPAYKLQLSTDSAAKPTSALWTIASDERIKENINPYKKGLQELLKINPITYDYNGLGGFAKGKGGVGIIAQQIIDILPDSVNSVKAKLNETDEEETDILNFNGHELIYVLINSIKEQQAQIEELKGMIAAK